MSIRKTNEIFGYGYYILGVSKMLFVIYVLMQSIISLITISSGGNGDLGNYSYISIAIGFLQIILGIGSVVMIILNIKKEPEVIKGYLMGLGSLLIEVIIPSIIFIFVVFLQCVWYMKAGNKICNKNIGINIDNGKIKQDAKNTEWFFGNDDENSKIEK